VTLFALLLAKENFAAWAKLLFQCLDASIHSLSTTTSTEHIEGV
jgi:hypothetical protein